MNWAGACRRVVFNRTAGDWAPGIAAWLNFSRRSHLWGRWPARWLRRPGTQNERFEATRVEPPVPLGARVGWEEPKASTLRSGLLAQMARVINVGQLAGADQRLY